MLRDSRVQVTEYRAAVIVGSGGISFEMIRYLAERMPVTFAPRRSADEVRVGDAPDYWRVEAVERDRFLLLRAEIKVPGCAWLQFKAVPIDGGGSQLLQAAFFAPTGLFGLLYW